MQHPFIMTSQSKANMLIKKYYLNLKHKELGVFSCLICHLFLLTNKTIHLTLMDGNGGNAPIIL
jgi:hypothetical protein